VEYDITGTSFAAVALTELSVDGHECCCGRCSDDDYSSNVEFMKLFSLHFIMTLFLMWRSNKGH
jgi:hypothetical protein